VLTPKSISTDNFKVDFQYAKDENNWLTEIRQSDGTREMIGYSDKGIPKEYKRYLKDDLIYHVYYIVDEEGLVIKAIQYAVASGGKLLTLLGNYQIEYGTQKEIERVDWYDFRNMLTASKLYTYNTNLQVTGIRSSGATATVNSFQYDEHSGIFKHVSQAQLIAIEHQAFYMLNQKSNQKSITIENQPAKNLMYEMQYNVDGYPIKITQSDAANAQRTYNIAYR